jgi:hypothetical protein
MCKKTILYSCIRARVLFFGFFIHVQSLCQPDVVWC